MLAVFLKRECQTPRKGKMALQTKERAPRCGLRLVKKIRWNTKLTIKIDGFHVFNFLLGSNFLDYTTVVLN